MSSSQFVSFHANVRIEEDLPLVSHRSTVWQEAETCQHVVVATENKEKKSSDTSRYFILKLDLQTLDEDLHIDQLFGHQASMT